MSTHTPIQTNGLTAAQQLAIETLYQAFNTQTPALVDQALAPHWEDIPMAPGQRPGPQGLKDIVVLFGAAFPDVQIRVLDMFGNQNRAAVRALITGTHRGEFFGIPATGRAVEVAIHEFHHLGADRIERTYHLEDWFGLLNQVGAWPPAP